MKDVRLGFVFLCAVFGALRLSALSAAAQSCETAADLDQSTKTTLTATAQRYFDTASSGDTASLRASAIPSLASDFSGIDATIKEHQHELAGTQASLKSLFLLEADGTAPIPSAEFYCGVFGKTGQTSGSAEFFLTNLPPGKYGIAMLEAAASTQRISFSVVLQQIGTDWKLAGLYLKPSAVAGHDSDWFLARAREFKAKGQVHNAWFFYLQARNMMSPLPFMSTLASEKLTEELQKTQPTDLPSEGKTADLTAGTSTYKLTAVFAEEVSNDFDLVVRYQASDVSNTNQAYQNNVAVIKALVTKFPEVRDAFAGVVARAVDPNGHDYGTLLAMKDIR